MEFITPEYVVNIIFMVMAFLTLVKLLSSDVYLNHHRLLPCIAAVVMIYDFYIVIMPFVEEKAAELLRVLADLCSMISIFMMFFYLLMLKRPRFYRLVITASVIIMIVLNFYEFLTFSRGGGYDAGIELIALGVVATGSLYAALIADSNKPFDREDKVASRMMFSSFIVALIGYLLQSLFHNYIWILGLAFAVNCVLYYYMADTNRIEDTAVVMSNTVFNTVTKPMVIVNPHFYIVDVNKAAQETFTGGRFVSFAFEGGDYQNKFKLGQTLVERNENDKEFFAGDRWYILHWNKVDSRKRNAKGYVFSLTDVTDSHQEIQQARAQTKEKSQFLAHMSHELRSPLHAIIGVSDILLGKHDISTKNRNLVQHIKKASDGLLDVVDSILDFSKLEAGKFTFAEARYEIEPVFEELSYNNIVNLQSKPVDFNIEIVTDYPKYLFGDVMRVREIFQNLLSNAVKFTDSGYIYAKIAFEPAGEDRTHITFSVKDSGRGMSPEQINSVFGEYVSLSDSSSMEGTGLGLSITKQLIELMGGSISVESDGVSGSTFSGDFYQGVFGEEVHEKELFNRKTAVSANKMLDPENMRVEWIYPEARILVADDMKINLEIITQILSPWKCQVICVSDGIKAVEAVKNHKFDMVLLDQMMAPMGGLEAADEIRRISDVPIVLVTANTEDNVRSLIKDHGINDFVGKPIHLQQIGRVVDEYMPAELRQKNLEMTVTPSRREVANSGVYRKTLETFVREMEPLLLHLPNYAKNDHDMFKIKAHGIKGVSRQIGRETFADKAEIMEMAAKAEHWNYVDAHLDAFLNSLCDVIEDVTIELTMLAPDNTAIIEEDIKTPEKPVADETVVRENFEALLNAFDSFDISQIEQGINMLENMSLDKEQTKIFTQIVDAYEELEYEMGSNVLSAYLEKEQ